MAVQTNPPAGGPPACAAEGAVVVVDAVTARRAGIQTVRAEVRPIAEHLLRNAEVEYDPDRWARLSPRASGTVVEVPRTVGDPVVAGDVLVVVDSAELGQAKAEFLRARTSLDLRQGTYDRAAALQPQGAASGQAVREAEAALAEARVAEAAARQRLRTLGLGEDQVEAAAAGDTSSTLSLRSPIDGVVVERSAVLGQVVGVGDVLFEVADVTRLWLRIDAAAADLPKLAAGRHVLFRVDGLPGETFRGLLVWLGSSVDDRTRTVPVRAIVENEDGLLRPMMFGRAEVLVRDAEPVLAVPREAVQFEGCCHVVFVERSPGLYDTRRVRLGAESGGWVEILQGVSEGDAVVTAGSFLMKTEILRSSIGAGCCD